ncbi:hypothetical protein MNBD_GAMMA11-3424 [hydrothermal vent metagenome]|uniref:N-acetyltransferase domain-containing protein n=1 Tax=hydrothermal vent metagenome TaxID=652676 RepID=A0A3B0XPQ7_9ZZZZ
MSALKFTEWLNVHMNKIQHFIATNSIAMREFDENDFPCIYDMYINRDLLHLWSPNTEFESFLQFKEMLKRRFLYRWDHGLVFVEKKTDKIIGFAYCYSASEINKNACACVFIDQPYIGRSFALQSSYLYLSYLFEEVKYRKVYAEVYEYNTRCIHLLRHLGFDEEGCLKEHQLWEGKYWNQYVFSITNNLFENRCKQHKRIIERVTINE